MIGAACALWLPSLRSVARCSSLAVDIVLPVRHPLAVLTASDTLRLYLPGFARAMPLAPFDSRTGRAGSVRGQVPTPPVAADAAPRL